MSYERAKLAAVAGLDRGLSDFADPKSLLDSITAESMRLRTGFRPVSGLSRVTASEPDTLPPVDEALLRAVLGAHEMICEEWCRVAAQNGWRAPDDALISLMEWGHRTSGRRRLVAQVLGNRGRWLAQFDEDFVKILIGSVADIEQTWSFGSDSDRRGLIEDLASTDHAHAARLVGETWSTEAAKNRSAYIEALMPHAELIGEAFFEGKLDDRSGEVRTLILRSLAKFRSNTVSDRIWQATQKLITKSMLGGLKFALPEEDEPIIQELKLETKSNDGVRQGLLARLISFTDPARWVDAYGDPRNFIPRLAKEFPKAVLVGFGQAAVAHQNPSVASAVLGHPETPPELDSVLISALDQEDFEKWLLVNADRASHGQRSQFELSLDRMRPLSLKCSEQLLKTFARNRPNQLGIFYYSMKPVALYLHPHTDPRLLDEFSDDLENPVAKTRESLRIRRQIYESLTRKTQ